MKKILFAFTAIAAAGLLVFACQKDSAVAALADQNPETPTLSDESVADRGSNCFVNFRITQINTGGCTSPDFYAVLSYYTRNETTGQLESKCMRLTAASPGPVTVSILKSSPYTIVHHYRNNIGVQMETRIDLSGGIGSGYESTQSSGYVEGCTSCDAVIERSYGGTITTSCSISNTSTLGTCSSCLGGICNTVCNTTPLPNEGINPNCMATFSVISMTDCDDNEPYAELWYQYEDPVTHVVKNDCRKFTSQTPQCDIQIRKGTTFYILHHHKNKWDESFIETQFRMGTQYANQTSDWYEGCDWENCTDEVEHVFTGTVGGDGQTTAVCSFSIVKDKWFGCTPGVYSFPAAPYQGVEQCPIYPLL